MDHCYGRNTQRCLEIDGVSYRINRFGLADLVTLQQWLDWDPSEGRTDDIEVGSLSSFPKAIRSFDRTGIFSREALQQLLETLEGQHLVFWLAIRPGCPEISRQGAWLLLERLYDQGPRFGCQAMAWVARVAFDDDDVKVEDEPGLNRDRDHMATEFDSLAEAIAFIHGTKINEERREDAIS